MIYLKSPAELARMREAGRIVANILEELRGRVRPGITTGELDKIAEDMMRRAHATSSAKGYRGPERNYPPFPGAICTSVNEELVHGIPGRRRLEEGDIVTIDVTVQYRGWHADAAVTVPVGNVSPQALDLIDATQKALYVAIKEMRPGNRVGDVAGAIQEYVERRGYNVTREYTSHGIGRTMHEEPQIPNYGQRGRGALLRPGITVALEPMVSMGHWDTRVLPDEWTVVMADGKLAAHFEHTVAVTPDGPMILTLP
jgi:methionyl aminopeptidase